MAEMVIASAAGDVLLRVNLEGREKLTLGRSPRCDVRLRGTKVARHHALLFTEHGQWVIAGLTRTPAVWIGTRPTCMARVNEEEPVRLGDAFLWFFDLTTDDPPPLPDLDEATYFKAGTRAEFLESVWRSQINSEPSRPMDLTKDATS